MRPLFTIFLIYKKRATQRGEYRGPAYAANKCLPRTGVCRGSLPLPFCFGSAFALFDLFMVKVIDDDGRGCKGAAESVVVDGIFRPFPPGKGAHRCVQRPPKGAAAAAVAVIVACSLLLLNTRFCCGNFPSGIAALPAGPRALCPCRYRAPVGGFRAFQTR